MYMCMYERALNIKQAGGQQISDIPYIHRYVVEHAAKLTWAYKCVCLSLNLPVWLCLCLCVCLLCVWVCVNHRVPNKYAMKIHYKARQKKAKSFLLFMRLPSDCWLSSLSFPYCFTLELQEAKETLCDPEKRAVYDKWRNSGISMSYKQWLGMKEHVGQVRRYTIAEKVDKEVCSSDDERQPQMGKHREVNLQFTHRL